MKKADRSYSYRPDLRLAVLLMPGLIWYRIGIELASLLLQALGWATLICLESLVAKECHSAPQATPFNHSTARNPIPPSFKPSHLSVLWVLSCRTAGDTEVQRGRYPRMANCPDATSGGCYTRLFPVPFKVDLWGLEML